MKVYETLVNDIIQEELNLRDKINRLEYFMMTEDYQKIGERQQLLLTQQLAAMNNYKGCLISRVLQLRFEHEENKNKTCEPEPEKSENHPLCTCTVIADGKTQSTPTTTDTKDHVCSTCKWAEKTGPDRYKCTLRAKDIRRDECWEAKE